MTDFTPREIEDAIEKSEEEGGEFEGENTWGMIKYEDVPDDWTLRLRDEDVPVKVVKTFGGEGKGDEFWVVIGVGNQLFRKDGYYYSAGGGELDGDLYEVRAVERLVTFYE